MALKWEPDSAEVPHWGWIDLDAKLVKVRATLARAGDGTEQETSSGSQRHCIAEAIAAVKGCVYRRMAALRLSPEITIAWFTFRLPHA